MKGSGMTEIKLTVNNNLYELTVRPWRTLLDVLREELKLTGTKEGCGVGECGACTVIMEGKAVNSCLVLASEADGKEILTIEGLTDGDKLHPIQEAFVTHGGMNSVNEGLNYGVPLVVVPQQIEQAINGRQVARQRAGIVLADRPPYGSLEAGVLRSAVDQALADPTYRLNAERIRRSFHEAGGYQRAAALITSWAGQGRPGNSSSVIRN